MPAGTSVMVKPAVAASATGQTRAAGWLAAVCFCAQAARRSAMRAEKARSIGERVARAGGEEGAGDRIEDGGVDQAVAGAERVVRSGEVAVAGEDGVGEGAEGFGREGLSLGAEQEAGGGLVLLHELVGVEVVGGGENPGGGCGGGGGVGGEAEVGVGGEGWGVGVGGGYEDGLIGEGGGEVGEGRGEGFGGEWAEARRGGRTRAALGGGVSGMVEVVAMRAGY